MPNSKLNPENAKELKDLTKLVSGRKHPTAKKLTQNEARAVLKYIEALEKAAEPLEGQAKRKGDYNESDKKLAMLKLFGIASGLPYED